MHLVRLICPARATTSSSLVEHLWVSHQACRRAGREPGPGEWLSTTELQSKRSNPNARRQLGVRKEAAPLPPNHGSEATSFSPKSGIFGAFGALFLALTSPRRHFTKTSGVTDKWSYLAGSELTEGVVEHSKVQSFKLRSNSNTRQQLKHLKEGDPYPPNHSLIWCIWCG